jgi:hypothetical protein
LSAIIVEQGQLVIANPDNRKNVVGISGSTGNSSGAHLHFSLTNPDGIYVNPYGWQGPPGQDPWESSLNPLGAPSYDVWEQEQYPAIQIVFPQTELQYPTSAAVTAPPVNDYLIEVDDESNSSFFDIQGTCWTPVIDTEGIDGDYHYAGEDASADCYARWLFDPSVSASAGDYDIYVHIPGPADALSAEYTIVHSGGSNTAIVVQAAYGDEATDDWAYIGRYYFNLNGSQEYVQISSSQTTDDPDAEGTVVVADAIRLHPAEPSPDLEFNVSQSSNDAGPNPLFINDCSDYETDWPEIYLGYCQNGDPIVSGFRFQNITIPDDVTIAEARLEFTVDGPGTAVIDVQFRGELANDTNTFSDTDKPSDRAPLTNAAVLWHIGSEDEWLVEEIRYSPDLSAIVQEIIDQTGWVDGNSMVIIMQTSGSGTGSRRVFGWDRDNNPFQTAKLQIRYMEPPAPTPTPAPSPTPSSSVPPPTGLTAVYHNGLPQPTGDDLQSFINVGSDPIESNVRLSWQIGAYPPGTTFKVYRHSAYPVPVDGIHRIASNVSPPWYTDFYGQEGDWYVVTAVNTNGESAPSNHAQANPYCPGC